MTHAVSASGFIKVEWVDLGEGISGDYDAEHPGDDIPLLRYDISVSRKCDKLYEMRADFEPPGVGVDSHWGAARNGSFCSQVPAWTAPDRLEALARNWADQLSDSLISGRFNQVAEGLSWITIQTEVANDTI
jgi:hypothetical protein